MGIHESQSLLWERMVALGLPFAKYVSGKVCGAGCWGGPMRVTTCLLGLFGFPPGHSPSPTTTSNASHSPKTQIRKHFPTFPERPAEDFYAAVNTVKDPSFIRVESDEVGVHDDCVWGAFWVEGRR